MKNFLERCNEEHELLLEEAESLFKHHFGKKESLTKILERHCHEESKLSNGMCNNLRKKICEINNVLLSLRCTLSNYLKSWLVEKLSSIHNTSSFHMSNELKTFKEDNEIESTDEDIIEKDLVDLLDDRDEDEDP